MLATQSKTQTRHHKPKPTPDLDALYADALLTRKQVAALTGYALITLKKWAEKNGKGPKVTVLEGRPRYRAADVRAWIRGTAEPGAFK